MASDPLPPRKPISNPERSKFPSLRVPDEIAALIATAFAHRAALEASAVHDRHLDPMWDLTSQLCARIGYLAAEPGVVSLRLCELPSDSTPQQVWSCVRTAARADAWEYTHDHHHCVRVGDWHGWAA